ncbi:GreA/GreB family elongation factor [Hymenobacter cellulosivorans]|uniref:GreA/GreB family elongation factor n=1 Tax=Hymenobacter cellulosivorans TaxID=2932249 RepID=A0ABY4FG99_9BACT|nr:GreA/GreB family elongation factor [Hymenobacter cellulosivorans]UOQ55032.1 GreA/GreB family elongation factor [Hymenobacter cellulosivorans]
MPLWHSPSDIYVTKPDYARLTQLVQQEPPPTAAVAVAALRRALTQAHLINSYDIVPGVATMNCCLTLRSLTSSEEQQLTLVYPPAADPVHGRISILSAEGLAILGVRLGDKVRWLTPQGAVGYRVEAILPQPEATGILS